MSQLTQDKINKDKKDKEEIIFPSFPCPECGGDGEECGCSFADYFNHNSD